jgi:hypothetical protein
MALGLIAYFAIIFYLQSRNQWYFVLPPIFCLEISAGLYWGRHKKQVERLFFCIGIIRFDLALHMMFFHIAFFLIIIIIIKKKFGENLQDIFFSLAYQIIACIFSRYLNSLGINLLCLDIIERF